MNLLFCDFYEFNNCYLSHSSQTIIKNKDFINYINSINKEFIYQGFHVFTNDAPIIYHLNIDE